MSKRVDKFLFEHVRRRVVVTGLGAVSPLGVGVQRSWTNLVNGRCGIVKIPSQYGDFQKNESKVAGLVPRGPKSEGRWSVEDWLSKGDTRKLARFMQYGLVAAQEALDDAKWHPQTAPEQEATGVCLGSGIGAFEDIYDTAVSFSKDGPKKVSPYFVPRILTNLGAGHISMKFGFRGPTHAATTACATGAHSIGDAARYIQAGDADVMVAGGAESCIHPLAFAGFERSKSLTKTSNETPESASRPFSKQRSGFVMAEGAAVLILEEREHAIRRGAKIYAELAGYGTSSDAHHLTQPSPDGHGALRAMRRALEVAGLNPFMIDYINAHGTSTQLGDAAEAHAIAQLALDDSMTALYNDEDGFDDSDNFRALVSSTKGATGHLLGAAGALEALFTILTIKENLATGTLNLRPKREEASTQDPDLPSTLNLLDLPAVHQDVDVALTNSFGFGGVNASLCFVDAQSDKIRARKY